MFSISTRFIKHNISTQCMQSFTFPIAGRQEKQFSLNKHADDHHKVVRCFEEGTTASSKKGEIHKTA
jgi:hypothetical protein